MQICRCVVVLALLVATVGGDEITWSAPEATAAGSSPAVTGYEVWEETAPGTWSLDQSVGAGVTSATVSAGTYAVRATFSGGRTALSVPVTTNDWVESLPVATEANSVEATDSRATIQAAIDGLSAGDTLYFRGGTYSHTASTVFLTVGVDGTSGNEINLVAYPGESPVLEGPGWADDDVGPGGTPFCLVRISGDYVRFRGFKVCDSETDGLCVDGSNVLVEECEFTDNWNNGLVIGDHDGATPTLNVSDVTVRYCNSHHNRDGAGIFVFVEDEDTYFADDVTIEKCLLWANGRNADGTLHISGAGNSDGLVVSKNAHDNYLVGDLNPTAGRANRIQNLVVRSNIVWGNGDDGIDTSSGDGSLFIGNIAFSNYPSGAKGFKILRDVWENQKYVGNVALGADGSLNGSTELFFKDGSAAFTIGETITGGTSGAIAVVDGFDIFTADGGTWAGGDAEGRMVISSLVGEFREGEAITGSSTGVAALQKTTPVLGFDQRVGETSLFFDSGSVASPVGQTITGGTSGATATVDSVNVWSGSWAGGDAAGVLLLETVTGTFIENEPLEIAAEDRATSHAINSLLGFGEGRVDSVNWTILNFDAPGVISDRGMWVRSNPLDNGDLKNCLSYQNEVDDLVTGSFATATNHLNDDASAPGVHDVNYEGDRSAPTGATIRAKWRTRYRAIMEELMAADGGNLENAGTLDTDYHHATAADHATTPSDPSDGSKMAWHGTAPDVGASPFFELWAPVLSVGSGSSGGTAAKSVTAQGFTVGGN